MATESPVRWRMYPFRKPRAKPLLVPSPSGGMAFGTDPATTPIEPKSEWFDLLKQWCPGYEAPHQPDTWMLRRVLMGAPFYLKAEEFDDRFAIPQAMTLLASHTDEQPDLQPPEGLVPVWDNARRELRLGDRVCKRYSQSASNQWRVLDAFEEEGWPDRIDDPLEHKPGIAPKARFRETIRSLNRGLRFIEFRCDGTGEGVIWKSIPEHP